MTCCLGVCHSVFLHLVKSAACAWVQSGRPVSSNASTGAVVNACATSCSGTKRVTILIRVGLDVLLVQMVAKIQPEENSAIVRNTMLCWTNGREPTQHNTCISFAHKTTALLRASLSRQRSLRGAAPFADSRNSSTCLWMTITASCWGLGVRQRVSGETRCRLARTTRSCEAAARLQTSGRQSKAQGHRCLVHACATSDPDVYPRSYMRSTRKTRSTRRSTQHVFHVV